MSRWKWAAIILVFAGCHRGVEHIAPLLEGLGDHHHVIKTQSAMAQRYFDQGLILAYGFNHKEAVRSFKQAALYDPGCAMCYWGAALALGPNINAPMDDAAVPEAWTLLQKAMENAAHARESERDYINALAARYSPQPVADRSELDREYANAMREVAASHRDDLDAQVLFVEALMDTMPWDYWVDGETPKPEAAEGLGVLESVLARDPNHVGANHFYIHMVEASAHPERGEAAADRLTGLVPGAGHLVHMPSHIYVRIGRYHDATLANQHAVLSDEAYIAQCRAQGIYPVAYFPHNLHFLWMSLAMEGRGNEAIAAARTLEAKMTPEVMESMHWGMHQHFWGIHLFALVAFGRWSEVLADPPPPEEFKYAQAIWRYARGMALAAQDDPEGAQAQLSELQRIMRDPEIAAMDLWDINSVSDVLAIGKAVLTGRIAMAKGEQERAIKQYRNAVQLQDALRYNEPEDWYQSTRLFLGDALLQAGQGAEAETVFRDDLHRRPRNGWALFGLTQALEAEGKAEEASEIRAAFKSAWSAADTPLGAAHF